MKICNDRIKDITDKDKQVLYDAMALYIQHCSKNAFSNQIGSGYFKQTYETCVDIIKQMRERWEVLH